MTRYNDVYHEMSELSDLIELAESKKRQSSEKLPLPIVLITIVGTLLIYGLMNKECE